MIVSGKKIESFSSKFRRQGYQLSPLLLNIVLDSLARTIIEGKAIKGIQVGK